ncbi:MAG: hypothetical protein MZV65_31100 [Chromatiales bacterium]|nr:hypothetical protein [Chromatiales bacterium]
MTAAFLPQDLIRRKRDGVALSPAEIDFLVQGMVDQTVSEGQLAAFAMAVCFRGLNPDERIALTRAMTRSGDGAGLDRCRAGRPGARQAFHRRGRRQGQPDPGAAGGGLRRLRADGRGPGPGPYRRHAGQAGQPSPATPSPPICRAFARWSQTVGCAIVGQTAELAPADRRFYAMRDVTATVESLDLIVASILSKKLAEGLQGLVLDVKTGSGRVHDHAGPGPRRWRAAWSRSPAARACPPRR